MLKIWSMKQKQQEEEAAGPRVPKMSSASLRVQKDADELGDNPTMTSLWEDPSDLLHFTLTIKPDEGMFAGGEYKFTFDVPEQYPHEPPKVLCTQKIYHPNIDLEGKICLNILREDWKPVLHLNAIFVGLQYLFLEPNADDPLNKDAAEVLRKNRDQFMLNVKNSMAGGFIDGVQYDDIRPQIEPDSLT